MNSLEKSKYMMEVAEFLERKRVYAVFEDLYRSLAIEQPADPIAFLIKRLKTTRRFFIRETDLRDRTPRLQHQGNHPQAEPAL